MTWRKGKWGGEKERGLRRRGYTHTHTHTHTQLIHCVVQQKLIQYCKATIPQWKINVFGETGERRVSWGLCSSQFWWRQHSYYGWCKVTSYRVEKRCLQFALTSWKEPTPAPVGCRPNSAHRLSSARKLLAHRVLFQNSNKLTRFKIQNFFFFPEKSDLELLPREQKPWQS